MSIGLVRTLRVHTSSRCHFNVCVSVLDSLVVHHIYFYVFFLFLFYHARTHIQCLIAIQSSSEWNREKEEAAFSDKNKTK